jgi:hypothetical protein
MQPNPPTGPEGPVRPARRYTPTALPSPAARAAAFASILVAGVCGGLIGWALTDLQCTGDCAGWAGLGALVGALVAAGGVAVVAVLVLRAMAEWRRDLDPPA